MAKFDPEKLLSMSMTDRLELPSLLPGLSKEGIHGVPVEIDPGKYARFILYWYGVAVGEVTAERDSKGAVCLEVL